MPGEEDADPPISTPWDYVGAACKAETAPQARFATRKRAFSAADHDSNMGSPGVSIEGVWLLGAAGALSIPIGLVLVALPGAAPLSLAWLIGLWAAVFGALFIMPALRLRKFGKDLCARRIWVDDGTF